MTTTRNARRGLGLGVLAIALGAACKQTPQPQLTGSTSTGSGVGSSGASTGSSASSGAGGAAGAGGAGGAGGGSAFAGCPGVPLDQTGVLDLDLKAVHVNGAVTVNGAALPNVAGRGAIAFRAKSHALTATLALPSTGSAAYDVWLPPGAYDVLFVGDTTLCSADTTPPALPCNTGVIKTAVSLTADGVLDVDIPAVTLTGAVTVNGASMPSSSVSRGQLAFENTEGVSGDTVSFGTAGAASYGATLVAGSYDVIWEGNAAACGTTSSVACNVGPVKMGVSISQSGVLDVDVPTVQLSGKVTINGAPMGASESERGALGFRINTSDAGGTTLADTQGFGATGPASYAMTLLAGAYDIVWEGVATECTGTSPVPCNTGRVKQAIALSQSGALDVDVPSVQVSGTATIHGAALPSASDDRGSLTFMGPDDLVYPAPSFGSSGPSTYATVLVGATYTVGWAGNADLCAAAASPVPCNTGPFKPSVPLTQSGVLDVEVPTVQLTGNITVNRAAMPSATGERGDLGFLIQGGTLFPTAPLGATGPGQYTATLLGGSYVISWIGNPDLCGTGSPSPVPCNTAPLKEGMSITEAGALDVDVPTVQLQGTVTENGAVLPAGPGGRGTIAFVPPSGTQYLGASLGASGPGAHAETLVSGSYVILHEPNTELCGPTSVTSVPCAPQVLQGCN